MICYRMNFSIGISAEKAKLPHIDPDQFVCSPCRGTLILYKGYRLKNTWNFYEIGYE